MSLLTGFANFLRAMYVVQGYRDSFICFVPFWHHWNMTLYFWGVALFVFALGATVFLRLRPLC